jgi:hypothetical protein
MSDMIFEEIKEAILDNFENCEVKNRTTDIEVEFKNESDAKWFKENICYPKELKEEEYPIHFISSMSPLGDPEHIARSVYSISFEVSDKDRLISMLNNR